MEPLLFVLTFALVFYTIVWINGYFYRKSHLGNLGRERDYLYHYGSRGGVRGISEQEPDPLPRTEFVQPPQDRKPPC